MKIKTKDMDYEKVIALPKSKHKPPKRQGMFFRKLLKAVSASDLKATDFSFSVKGMEKLPQSSPALFLMNHSSFIDLKIASTLIYPRPFNIVCTSDGFVGKEWLMRNIGCIPTKKFVSELILLRDVRHCLEELKSSVLMYPEASYSFDGRATPLPDGVGKFIKMLGAPVVMITTSGAFARDPLYNNLQNRSVKVSAEMEYILSPDDIKAMSEKQLCNLLSEKFSFDYFRWQQDNRIKITEPFRADYLNRVLYKCPNCKSEGKTVGNGTKLVCNECGKSYELTEEGFLKADNGVTEFEHIPDWYAWQRECVKNEVETGEFKLVMPVLIRMMVDTKCIYNVGSGVLTQTAQGFSLVGCDGKLKYEQKSTASYSLYADYNWYELGDVICIGGTKALYYCFPQECGDVVAKARIAAEESYKLARKKREAVCGE